jgi:hypothetical protein
MSTIEVALRPVKDIKSSVSLSYQLQVMVKLVVLFTGPIGLLRLR